MECLNCHSIIVNDPCIIDKAAFCSEGCAEFYFNESPSFLNHEEAENIINKMSNNSSEGAKKGHIPGNLGDGKIETNPGLHKNPDYRGEE